MIFGEVLHLSSASATIVFIAVLVFFLAIEGVLHVAEVVCNKNGYKGLIKKLYREFMIMGFISFAIFLAAESTNFAPNEWFLAFEFAHIVVLFIGITFLIQAVLLVSLISSRNRTLLKHDNYTSERLLIEYIDLQKGGGMMKFLFDYGPVSIPVPELREKIEYKIIQEFFIRNYNLPAEFKFANYMCMVLKNYVIALVEVRPISWLIVACLVAVNYGRIAAIDAIFQPDVCKEFPDKSYSEHRMLAEAEAKEYSHICQEYTLRYVFFCSMLIFLFLLALLVASEVYIRRLIAKVLDQEETLEWYEEKEEEFRSSMIGESAFDAIPAPPAGARHGIRLLSQSKKHLIEMVEDALHHQHPHDQPAAETHSQASTQQARDSVNSDIEAGQQPNGNKFNRTSLMSTTKSLGYNAFIRESAAEGGEQQTNRRYLYLRCLERIMDFEYNLREDEARRMSIQTDLDDREHKDHKPHTGSQTKPLHRAGSRQHLEAMTRSRAGSAAGNESFFDLYKDSVVSEQRSPRKGSTASARSGEDLRSTFRTIQKMRATMIEAQKAAAGQLSAQHAGSHPPTPDNGKQLSDRKGSFIDLFKQSKQPEGGRQRSESKYFTTFLKGSQKEGTEAGETLRTRAYSKHFFEVAKEEEERESDRHSMLERMSIGAEKARGKVVQWSKKVGSAILGHHLGVSHKQLKLDKDLAELNKELSGIFAGRSADLYFFSVEFAILMQCLYIALWATNFVYIAQHSYHPVLWQIALVVPLPLNFFMLKQIIFTSCMLKSIVTVEKYVADKICEEALDERNVTQRLRKVVRNALRELHVDKSEWYIYLQIQFKLFLSSETAAGITAKNMKLLLHSLHVFLTDKSVAAIMRVIDFDKDGMVTWDDLSQIIFPDLMKKKVIKVSRRPSKHDHNRYSFDYQLEDALSHTAAKKHAAAVARSAATDHEHEVEMEFAELYHNDELKGSEDAELSRNLPKPAAGFHGVSSGEKTKRRVTIQVEDDEPVAGDKGAADIKSALDRQVHTPTGKGLPDLEYYDEDEEDNTFEDFDYERDSSDDFILEDEDEDDARYAHSSNGKVPTPAKGATNQPSRKGNTANGMKSEPKPSEDFVDI